MVTITTHSPYILSELNVLMAASEAFAIDPIKTQKIINPACIPDKGDIAAYWISENGIMENIIDDEIYMVSGTKLDGVSDIVENNLSELNDIICS